MSRNQLSRIFFPVISFLLPVIIFLLEYPPEFITSNANKWLYFFGCANILTWDYEILYRIILFLPMSLLVMVAIYLVIFVLKSKVGVLKQEKPYDWGRFNSSLEEILKLFEQNVLVVDNPINKHMNYKNMYDRLIKEGEVRFSTNYAGYTLLTKYRLPHKLMLQLLKRDKDTYYMRFIANPAVNPEFIESLVNPECKFSPLSIQLSLLAVSLVMIDKSYLVVF